MNLNHYFDPVDFSKYQQTSVLNWRHSIGANIERNTLKLNSSNLENVDLAVVGVPFETRNNDCVLSNIPDLIRAELYQLTSQGKFNIVDFGNLKIAKSNKGNYLALRDVIDFLSEIGVTTIVLGGSQDFSYGVCQAFRNNKLFSFSTIDAFLDIKKGREPFSPENYLSRIFSNQPDIFQFSLVGYQKHYVPDAYLAKIKGIGDHIRLGELRRDLTLAESVFRNTDFLSVDFGTLKFADAFGKKRLPNGLQNEEICQLAKYAGLSYRLKVLGLFDVVSETENSEITVQLAAQVVWYFIEGYRKQSKLKPEDVEGFTVHRVEISDVDMPLVFYENNESGQWWIQVQTLNNKTIYLACSERDYMDACHNEIPSFWLKYIQKIDDLLK